MGAIESECCFTEKSKDEMAITVAVLEERVNGHIKFVWALMSVGFAWLIGISLFLFNMNGTMNRVEKAQVNAPAQIVARLLTRPAATKEEASDALLATTVVLKQSKPGPVKPDAAVLKQAGSEIVKSQEKYPDLPAAWQAMSAFINYRSAVFRPSSSKAADARGVLCKVVINEKGLVFQNCEIALEDLADRFSANEIDNAPASVYFVNCIVTYNGGPILDGGPSLKAKNLYFSSNCILDFRVNTTPPPVGISAMRQLITTGENPHVAL